jgi:metal-responsive CopG/Arc/MetJ family transcriptional regulator
MRLPPDLLAALDSWISAQPEQPGRTEAIRTIVREYLTSVGYIEPEPDEGEE